MKYCHDTGLSTCPGRTLFFKKKYLVIWKVLMMTHDIYYRLSFFSFQTRQTIEKLQTIVSSDGRFRNLRDALHRCDPPCIPYLGMYLTDLSFIEEGTPNFTEDGLLNFSKMRMVCIILQLSLLLYYVSHLKDVGKEIAYRYFTKFTGEVF